MWVAEYPPLLPKSQMALNVMAFTAVWLQTGKKCTTKLVKDHCKPES